MQHFVSGRQEEPTNSAQSRTFANPGASEMQLVCEMDLSEAVRPILCLQEDIVTGPG